MAAACRKSFQVRKGGGNTIEYVSTMVDDGTIMRKKINTLRRRYQRIIRGENLRKDRKQLYQQEKKKYVTALRK